MTSPKDIQFVARPDALDDPPKRWIRGVELRTMVIMSAYSLASLALPQQRWHKVADGTHRIRRAMKPKRRETIETRYRGFFGRVPDEAEVKDWFLREERAQDRRRFYITLDWLSNRWRPQINMLGAERIDEALEQGNGVILWFANFLDHNVIAKRGLAEAGYQMHYLSSVLHGDFRSHFGRRVLNRLQIKVERRYLAERIVIDGHKNVMAVTKRLAGLLGENRIVGISNTVTTGRKLIEAPFGSDAHYLMPTTPLSLAQRTGATILPVATREDESAPMQAYDVIIGPPLPVEAKSGKRDDGLIAAAEHYIDWVTPLVEATPERFGWGSSVRIS